MSEQLKKIRLEPKAEKAFWDLNGRLEHGFVDAAETVRQIAMALDDRMPKEIRFEKIRSLDSLRRELFEIRDRLEELMTDALYDHNIAYPDEQAA